VFIIYAPPPLNVGCGGNMPTRVYFGSITWPWGVGSSKANWKLKFPDDYLKLASWYMIVDRL
jgi:hypothetical protein